MKAMEFINLYSSYPQGQVGMLKMWGLFGSVYYLEFSTGDAAFNAPFIKSGLTSSMPIGAHTENRTANHTD